MNVRCFTIASLFSICLLARATISLEFSYIPPSYIADGFRDAQGVVQNGMPWGIVVNTSGVADFSGLTSGIESFDINTKGTYIAADLLYLFGNTETPPVTQTVFGSFSGAITELLSVSYDGLSQGDPFAIVWFPEMTADLGASYGVLTDPGFIIPADGTDLLSYAQLPVFASGEGNFVAEYNVVPEPSTYALGLGVFVMLVGAVRRRGKKRA